MLVDLVQTTTRDGIRLDGAYQSPADPASVAVDAFCLLHGTGGNFYNSTLLDGLTERLLALGCGVLRVNTRGHDGISSAATARGGRRLGAAYEIVDDCRHDVAAWVEWLRHRAGPRIGLAGHSLGAVKALYSLAQEPAIGAVCVLGLSPPRLSYSTFCAGPQAQDFLATYHEAERRVRNGEPAALLDVKLPLPFVITAAGYVDKYGPDERYDYLRFVAGVPCPTLITLGGAEVETNMAFRGAPEALAAVAARHPRLRVTVLDGADHFYTAARPELAELVESWLREVMR
jgi:alpha-beta hydrolase superfamily lysophospholipase